MSGCVPTSIARVYRIFHWTNLAHSIFNDSSRDSEFHRFRSDYPTFWLKFYVHMFWLVTDEKFLPTDASTCSTFSSDFIKLWYPQANGLAVCSFSQPSLCPRLPSPRLATFVPRLYRVRARLTCDQWPSFSHSHDFPVYLLKYFYLLLTSKNFYLLQMSV